MAYQKLQSSEALKVIPSNTVRIPDPTSAVNLISTTVEATDGVTMFQVAANVGTVLTGTNTKFTEMNITPGMIVYNGTASECYYVVSVDSDTQITVSAAVGGGASDYITIYARPTVACTLFVGTAGDIHVKMAEQGGNVTAANTPANTTQIYKNIANGSFMPIQVIQVYVGDTTASNIIAMW
jgi:hypothetical protein